MNSNLKNPLSIQPENPYLQKTGGFINSLPVFQPPAENPDFNRIIHR
jgi:hypothetical protein